MFNVEPLEPWTPEEREEFEQHVSRRQRRTIREAAWAGLFLLVTCLCIVPFSAGHAWNKYWDTARHLVYLALLAFLWFVYKVALIWASWQAARDTRREMEY